MVWSRTPETQSAWVVAGVAGELSKDSVALNVLNRGGNKLDPYLNVKANLAIGPDSGVKRSGKFVVTLVNNTPENGPVYILGPDPQTDLQSGEYLGFLSLNLPQYMTDVSFAGSVAHSGKDGATNQFSIPIRIKRGDTQTIEISVTLPATDSISIAPSARIPPIQWSYEIDGQKDNNQPWTDDNARSIGW